MFGRVASQPVIDLKTGEVLAERGDLLDHAVVDDELIVDPEAESGVAGLFAYDHPSRTSGPDASILAEKIQSAAFRSSSASGRAAA